MTVCIGSIADHGKAIILVSDRMVTVAYVEEEDRTEKIQYVYDGEDAQWYGMIAGNPSIGREILNRCNWGLHRLKDSQGSLQLGDIRGLVQQASQMVWKDAAEGAVLRPKGLTWELLNERPMGLQPLNNSIVSGIYGELAEWNNGEEAFCHLIVAGFDEEGFARIYRVRPPGNVEEIFDSVAIGIGSLFADTRLNETGFHWWEDTIHEALYLLLDAKFYAQRAPGVGEATTVWLILPGKNEPIWVPPEIINDVVDVYTAYPKSPLAKSDPDRRWQALAAWEDRFREKLQTLIDGKFHDG